MRSKLVLILVAAVLFRIDHSAADIIYDVTFENPPHTIGYAPEKGAPPDCPFDGQLFVVTASTSPFTSQFASTEGSGYAFINFHPGETYTSGIHSFSWQWALLQPDPATILQSRFDLQGGPSQSPVSISYYNDGVVVIKDSGGGVTNLSYTTSQLYTYELIVDLDTDAYSLSIDGSPILTSQPLESGADTYGIIFMRPPSATPVYGIDNVRWEVIPEPSTNALLFLGGVGFALKRLYDKHVGR